MTSRHSETAFEKVIEAHLLGRGYVRLDREGFDRERAVFPEAVLGFIRETQPTEWAKLEALHGAKTGDQVLADLCKWMDTNGSLATLRHGFKCYGRTLRVAFFKAAHELNPELEARYAANRLGLTRQLRFSPRPEKSLDVTLSLNGIPIVTVELKNPMTGQTVDDALRQYRRDLDPREPIFEFKRRTLVHFAADTEAVRMTTRLAGTATYFLPFDKGCEGGAGNPPDPAGRTYRTGYLWEESLERDSLLDILARFIHLLFVERMDRNEEIFVRYMNDLPFRDVVSAWMASEAYRRLRAVRTDTGAATSRRLPSGLQIVEGRLGERYKTCVPLVPLKAAAGAFSDPQRFEDDGFEWVEMGSRHRLRPGMFVAHRRGLARRRVGAAIR